MTYLLLTKLRKGIEQFSSVQLHTVLPSSADITKVSCKFGGVSKGSVLFRTNKRSDPLHINIDAPDYPSFILPSVSHAYSTVLAKSQHNFIDALQLSAAETKFYEKEIRNQADDSMWHKLRVQRITASKYNDICCC